MSVRYYCFSFIIKEGQLFLIYSIYIESESSTETRKKIHIDDEFQELMFIYGYVIFNR